MAPDIEAQVELKRVALITKGLGFNEGLLEVQRGDKFKIEPVVWIRPSMKLWDRICDLHRAVVRRSRINNTYTVDQYLHYFAFRPYIHLGGCKLNFNETAQSPQFGRELLRELLVVDSANHPKVAQRLSEGNYWMGLVIGSDVLKRKTIESIGLPLYNVHLSDPEFVRGQPPVFWEILDGRDSISITLHELILKLDAGAIVHQLESPIVWKSTLK